MIYSPLEYSKLFRFCGNYVSAMTIKRRCQKGQLPSGHHAKKLPGKTGGWIIEVTDEIVTKEAIKEKSTISLNKKHFSW